MTQQPGCIILTKLGASKRYAVASRQQTDIRFQVAAGLATKYTKDAKGGKDSGPLIPMKSFSEKQWWDQ